MEPALGLLEMGSVAVGVVAGDAMVKRAPVDLLRAGTVHPGKYLVLVAGQVADVEEALEAGRETAGTEHLLDEVFLPDVHPAVTAALTGSRTAGDGEAVGVLEVRTVAALLRAADRGVKEAAVHLREVRLADDLGGRAYCVFQGPVADVEAAVEAAERSLPQPDLLIARVVVPQIHDEMLANLGAAPDFRSRVRGND